MFSEKRLIVWTASLGLGMTLCMPLYAQQQSDGERSVREQGAGNDRVMQPSDLAQENLNLAAVTLKTTDRCGSWEAGAMITAAAERQEATVENCRSLSLVSPNRTAMMSAMYAQIRVERNCLAAGDNHEKGRRRGDQ